MVEVYGSGNLTAAQLRVLLQQHKQRAIDEGWWNPDRKIARSTARVGRWCSCPFWQMRWIDDNTIVDMATDWKWKDVYTECHQCEGEHPNGWCDIDREYDKAASAWEHVARENMRLWSRLVHELGLEIDERKEEIVDSADRC